MKLNASCWMIESKLTDSCQICECALWLCNTVCVCDRLAAWPLDCIWCSCYLGHGQGVSPPHTANFFAVFSMTCQTWKQRNSDFAHHSNFDITTCNCNNSHFAMQMQIANWDMDSSVMLRSNSFGDVFIVLKSCCMLHDSQFSRQFVSSVTAAVACLA